ncbi:MAG: hypothetical protein JWQ71_2406 [Pedosphaera sp.]|nr:hypothetical protein [Pedosphaera sp.]
MQFPIRLLQHKLTHLYYKSPGDWTPSADEADHFQDLSSAAQLCWNLHLEQVELVLNFGQPTYDIRLQIGETDNRLNGGTMQSSHSDRMGINPTVSSPDNSLSEAQ